VKQKPSSLSAGASRRDFLAASTAAVAGATLAALPAAHAGGSDVLRVGLVGCGGRGSGAVEQALNADPNLKLTAVGDLFPDTIPPLLDHLKGEKAFSGKLADKVLTFSGFDAYKEVIANCDVVLLCTPPHFRPIHFKAAVEAGKHIFAEKPVAVDAPGVCSVMESCREAKKKNLSVVSGLCYRYENAKRETMKRIHEGAVGDIVALHCAYNTRGLWHKGRQPGWSDMEWQIRNWLYFTWLSGDHIVEQHIHSLDKMAWAMKDEPPVKAIGLGGRQVRTDPKYGNVFDHHAVVFEYKNGVKLFSYCRQQNDTDIEVQDYILGTLGTCSVQEHKITGKNEWKHTRDRKDDMYQNEHNALFAGIRAGKPLYNGDYMCQSTLMAIMGRMATYTGKVITWEQALKSQQDLSPKEYKFGELSVAPVALPGVTKFS
jgi:myo-inositol 2-dehydrogenase / D-chiro-inositol 1-dehydrogenase